MSERYAILSDLHMGREPWRASAEMLRPLWQGVDHLIINGDVAELLDPRYVDLAEQETLRLQELCEADRVTLTLLAGNHDPDVTDQHFLFLAEQKILITHGDSVHPAIAPWCATAPLMQAAFEKAMAASPLQTHNDLASRLAATKTAARAKWEHVRGGNFHMMGLKRMLRRPMSFFEVLRYWHRFPDDAAAFVEKYAPQSSVLITGHTHKKGIWTRRGKTIINTGGFAFPTTPRRVVIEGTRIVVHEAIKDGKVYHPAPKAVAEIDVKSE
jgi:predicted phosphodiesterase